MSTQSAIRNIKHKQIDAFIQLDIKYFYPTLR